MVPNIITLVSSHASFCGSIYFFFNLSWNIGYPKLSLVHSYMISPTMNCHCNTVFSTSVSIVSLFITFLRNQLMTDVEGLLYVCFKIRTCMESQFP
jgi:hypothetical protein